MADARRASGFTLLEVLIALAILAVAFGFAFSAISDSMGSLQSGGRERDAVRVATTLLTRLGHDLPVVAGHSAGMDGPFSWTLDIDPDSADPPPVDGLAAHAVAVGVNWRDGRQSRQLRLRSVRLGLRDTPP